MLQGTPLGDEAARPGAPRPHPVIAAMNALGVDAAALGNHDLNYGLDHAAAAARDAAFPVLCANLRAPGGAARSAR